MISTSDPHRNEDQAVAAALIVMDGDGVWVDLDIAGGVMRRLGPEYFLLDKPQIRNGILAMAVKRRTR